jgi:cellulose synthase/poly-beta-1,6-N-acetylglucosamine synthase-like glycosyltransferase
MLNSYIQHHPVKTQRFLEILPGFFSWSLILFPVWGSLLIPEIVAYYIIAFNIYWLYRSLSLAVLAIVAHFRIQANRRYDWMSELRKMSHWDRIWHVIVIPTYKEPLDTLTRTLDNLSRQTYPVKKLAIMISFEEREGEAAHEKSRLLKAKYGPVFGHLWTTYHPDIAGEVKGKSSNTAWGAKLAKQKLVDEQGLSINFITITSQDADALLDHNYFAALTYDFLNSPARYRRIWQAAITFYNNIWQVPSPVRVLASIFSVMQMFVLMRKDRLINFSTYSTSLKMIDEIGYWDTNVIPEDYRLFFKAYFHFKGKIDVQPIFLPIYADAAQANGFWNTMINQYEQIKRWAWGASDDAYIIKQYLTVDGVPFVDKTLRVLKVLEDHFLWPVNWFAITIGALLPPLLNHNFTRTSLGKNLPNISSAILTVSLISLVVIFILDARNRPSRPKEVSIIKRLLQPLEFFLLPVVGFFFSALPGLDAHTRLMLGHYIEYKVTEKVAPPGKS